MKGEWGIDGFRRTDQAEKGRHPEKYRQATFTNGHRL
jgi:hypothetical protein